MNRFKVLAAVLMLATMLALTDCNSNEEKSAPPVEQSKISAGSKPAEQPKTPVKENASASLNPCDLITQETARDILGADVKEPVIETVAGIAGHKTCYYLTSAPIEKTGGTGSFRINVYDADSMQQAGGSMFKSPKKYFERNFEAQKGAGGKVVEISNLGDKAFWQSGVDELSVLTGDIYITLEIKDMVKLSAPNMTELHAKISEHRRDVSEKVMREVVLPRAAAKFAVP